jgi:hypothetical protein
LKIPKGQSESVRVRVPNPTFNNISVILVEETGVPGENHRPIVSHWQTLSPNVVSYTNTLISYCSYVIFQVALKVMLALCGLSLLYIIIDCLPYCYLATSEQYFSYLYMFYDENKFTNKL